MALYLLSVPLFLLQVSKVCQYCLANQLHYIGHVAQNLIRSYKQVRRSMRNDQQIMLAKKISFCFMRKRYVCYCPLLGYGRELVKMKQKPGGSKEITVSDQGIQMMLSMKCATHLCSPSINDSFSISRFLSSCSIKKKCATMA